MLRDAKIMEITRQRFASLPEVIHRSEKELAEVMGVTVRTYRKYCTKYVRIGLEKYIALMNTFYVNPEYFMGITDFPYIMTPEIVSFLKSYFALSKEEQASFAEQYLTASDDKKTELIQRIIEK